MVENQDLQCLLISNLKDAGCNSETIAAYLDSQDNIKKRMFILKKQRCYLLDQLHGIQKEIDCLDYLLYSLKKEACNHE